MDLLAMFRRRGRTATPTPSMDNAEIVLNAIVAYHYSVGGQNDEVSYPSFTVSGFPMNGRPHVNVRCRSMPGLERLRGMSLPTRRQSDGVLVGTLMLGIQGSVIYGDFEFVEGSDVELKQTDVLEFVRPE